MCDYHDIIIILPTFVVALQCQCIKLKYINAVIYLFIMRVLYVFNILRIMNLIFITFCSKY